MSHFCGFWKSRKYKKVSLIISPFRSTVVRKAFRSQEVGLATDMAEGTAMPDAGGVDVLSITHVNVSSHELGSENFGDVSAPTDGGLVLYELLVYLTIWRYGERFLGWEFGKSLENKIGVDQEV